MNLVLKETSPAAIAEFLTPLVQLTRTMGHREINGYISMDEFVLRNGRPMFANGEKVPPGIERVRKECYYNCSKAALDFDELIYCEGYAMGVIPVQHAWLIDHNGSVIEPTWNDKDGGAYFGLAIRTSYLMERLHKQTHYGGLIDQPHAGWPMLRAPVKKWRHPIMDRLTKL